jgi:DNA-binding PadR family transcriptional regulator
MAKYVQSGMRRDVLAILAGEPKRGQALKTALEDHYDERVDPKTFYGALDALADAGHVTERVDGVHDVYELTPEGRRLLEAHVTWLQATVPFED